ncbi:TetR/AcrR family transcriptional regulator [soil metagenome]
MHHIKETRKAMRYDAEHKQKTRDRVITVAKHAIRRGGVANLGVAAVMKDAGLTHGGFYAHFSSREALIEAAVEDMLIGARVRFVRVTEGLQTPEALGTYVDHYLSSTHRDSTTWLCPLPALSADMSRLEPSLREAFGRAAAGLAGLIQPMLAALGHDDPGVGRSVVSELVGGLALARAIGPTEQSDAILDASRLSIRRRVGLPDAALPDAVLPPSTGTIQ